MALVEFAMQKANSSNLTNFDNDDDDDLDVDMEQVIGPAGALTARSMYAELESRGVGMDGQGDDEEDDDDEEDSGGHLPSMISAADVDAETKEGMIRERISATQEAMKHILASMTAEQQHRYSIFRRVGLPRRQVERLMILVLERLFPNTTGNIKIHQNVAIAMAGIAKVYIGELIEEARMVMECWNGNDGGGDVSLPLDPVHIMEAQRRMGGFSGALQSMPFRRFPPF